MTHLAIEFVSKRYGALPILRDCTLAVEKGAVLTLLGPSGCGKTTLLRIIAGFVEPDAGRITVGGKDITHLPPNRRQVGFVFQNYALFPHLTVAGNVAYGLKVRRRPRRRSASGWRRALDLVALDGLRRPLPGAALGRPAAARRHRPRAGARAGRAAARRAVQCARRQAAPDDAGRAAQADRAGRHHVDLRHARPGRGDDAVRQRRRHARRDDRAGRARRSRSTTARGPPMWRTSSAARTSCRVTVEGGRIAGMRRASPRQARRRGNAHRPAREPRHRGGRGPAAGAERLPSRRRSGRPSSTRSTCGLAEPLRVVAPRRAGGGMIGGRHRRARRHRRPSAALLSCEGRAGHDG